MKTHLSERFQVVMVWWALITMLIYGAALWTMLKMVPPPSAQLAPDVIAEFYRQNASAIRIGAMIASWTSAFMVPLAIVIAAQMFRFEKGAPVFSMAQLIGGGTMSMFLVFPPIVWGIAAFSPDRPIEITAMLHEMGSLVLVTTDQYYMFQLIAIIYFCLLRPQEPLSPFPRWLGWFTIFAFIVYEVGPLGFMFKRGPFAWDGVIVFWLPFVVFGTWMIVTCFTMLGAIKRQRAAPDLAAIR